MWRRADEGWVRKPLPVCDFCDLQAVVAVPIGDSQAFSVHYGCSEHRSRLVEDYERLEVLRAKWARQRDELWES